MDLGKNKTEHVLLALLACLGVYLFVFMYLQISSIPDYREIKSSNTNSELVQEQVVLTADNIDSDAFVGGEVAAISRDANDSREFSNEDWSESTYKGDPEENAKEIERQLFEKAYERILSEFQIVIGVSLEDTQKKLDKALKRNLEGQAKAIAAPTKIKEPAAEPETNSEPNTDTED